jgi:hypothetical protein
MAHEGLNALEVHTLVDEHRRIEVTQVIGLVLGPFDRLACLFFANH